MVAMENQVDEPGWPMGDPVVWHEVAPRDGLQNESATLNVQQKLELLRLLVSCRPNSIEVTSFVRPDRVPQLADADQLCESLNRQEWAHAARDMGILFGGLLANQRGLERLLAANLDSATLLVSATDSHSQANVGMSRTAASEEMARLIKEAKSAGLHVRAYVSMAFVCPFEGVVDPAPVLDLMAQFFQSGADVVIPADTLGAAKPSDLEHMLSEITETLPPSALGMHLHNTHGRALENCQVAWEAGVRKFDSAIDGLGGCPFAPGAAGNLDSLELLKWAAENKHPHFADGHELQAAVAFLAKELHPKNS
jgi:hydroxymethylglutaryl-CoA lyase